MVLSSKGLKLSTWLCAGVAIAWAWHFSNHSESLCSNKKKRDLFGGYKPNNCLKLCFFRFCSLCYWKVSPGSKELQLLPPSFCQRSRHDWRQGEVDDFTTKGSSPLVDPNGRYLKHLEAVVSRSKVSKVIGAFTRYCLRNNQKRISWAIFKANQQISNDQLRQTDAFANEPLRDDHCAMGRGRSFHRCLVRGWLRHWDSSQLSKLQAFTS